MLAYWPITEENDNPTIQSGLETSCMQPWQNAGKQGTRVRLRWPVTAEVDSPVSQSELEEK